MPTKHCGWGTCNSDSRYSHKEHMKNVTFFTFPNAQKKKDECLEWIKACGRPAEDLNLDKITRYHYVCSKHFIDGRPTEQNPYPVSADPYTKGSKGRKRPKSRETPKESEPSTTKKQRVMVDVEFLNTKVDHPKFTCSFCKADVLPNPEEIKTFSRNSFMQKIVASDASCFDYTGVQTLKLLEYLFQWLAPSAKKHIKLWTGNKKGIPGRKKGRQRKLLTLFQEFVMTLVHIRKGFDPNHLA